MSFNCLCSMITCVLRLFLVVPRVGLWSVIMVFQGHNVLVMQCVFELIFNIPVNMF